MTLYSFNTTTVQLVAQHLGLGLDHDNVINKYICAVVSFKLQLAKRRELKENAITVEVRKSILMNCQLLHDRILHVYCCIQVLYVLRKVNNKMDTHEER